jgi:predicted N-acyltransferase
VSRGYLPNRTFSAHWIRDAGFREAVENFLARERRSIARDMARLEDERSPFRRDGGEEE